MNVPFCILSLACFYVSGCNDLKPGTYPEQSEMKKGPGVFTGEQGELDIISPSKLSSNEFSESSKKAEKDKP
jgi:hypothetical protein